MGGALLFPVPPGQAANHRDTPAPGALPAAGRPSPRRRGGGEEPGFKGRGKKEGDVWGRGETRRGCPTFLRSSAAMCPWCSADRDRDRGRDRDEWHRRRGARCGLLGAAAGGPVPPPSLHNWSRALPILRRLPGTLPVPPIRTRLPHRLPQLRTPRAHRSPPGPRCAARPRAPRGAAPPGIPAGVGAEGKGFLPPYGFQGAFASPLFTKPCLLSPWICFYFLFLWFRQSENYREEGTCWKAAVGSSW